jgi:spermidine/putrescine-binding protein
MNHFYLYRAAPTRFRWLSLGVAFLGLFWGGCKEAPDSSTRSDKRSATVTELKSNPEIANGGDQAHAPSSVPDKKASELSLLIWHNYVSPEVISGFEAKHGATVGITEVSNSEELKQRLAAEPAAFDLVVTDEQTLRDLVSLRLLRPIEAGEAPASPEVDPDLLSSDADARRYSVPYLWGLTVMAGRDEVLSGAVPSWELLLREDLRIGLIDEPFDLVWMGLLALGYDPEFATKAQIDETVARIAKRFPDITNNMFDVVSGLDALEAGELDILVTYNGDALARAAGNDSIRVILPEEGAPIWVDSFAVTRDAGNPRLANELIRFMNEPEASAETATFLYYATPIREARALVDAGLLENRVLYPGPDMIEKCRFVQFPGELEKYINQSLSRLIAGARTRSVALESEDSVGIPSEDSSSD